MKRQERHERPMHSTVWPQGTRTGWLFDPDTMRTYVDAPVSMQLGSSRPRSLCTACD